MTGPSSHRLLGLSPLGSTSFRRMPDAQGLKLVNLITTAIELVANLLLNLVLLPSYRALGAAIATLISYTLAVFAGLLLVPKAHPALENSSQAGMPALRPWRL